MRKAAAAAYPGDLLAHLQGFARLTSILEDGVGVNAFDRAARELAVDTSVLRRRLQTLADYVGLPLFTGRGSSLRLTPAGTRLRAQATQMIALASSIVAPRDDEDVGPLRVACTGTILAEVLPHVLASLRAEHSRLRFRVRREGAEASISLIEKDEVDFAIIRASTDPSTTRMRAKKVADDRLWLAAPKASELATAKRITASAIAKASLIGYPAPSATMKRLMSILGPLGAAPWIEVDRKAATLAYVGAGLGVGFVSRVSDQAPPAHRNVVMRDVTALFPKASFWLISPAATSTTTWKRDFAERLGLAMNRA